MPCPSCRGHRLFDDDFNPWWGCQDCGWMSDRTRNSRDKRDTFNLSEDEHRAAMREKDTAQ